MHNEIFVRGAMLLNEITIKDIERLSDVELSDILLRLLKFESERYQFTNVRDILVPLKINIGDAGEDGRLECGNTNGSKWVQNKFSIFQCKATDLKPKEVYNEFFSNPTQSKKQLKDKIKEVLDANGQYVFFIHKPYVKKLIDSRLDKARKALSYCNRVYKTKYKKEQVRILDANLIKDWVNEYINVVLTVQLYLRITRPNGLKTIEQWGEYEDIRRVDFVSNTKLDLFLKQIKNEVLNEKATIRIVGHSGLGKSRLVYEAFRSRGQLKNNAIYYDIIDNGQNIVDFVKSECSSLKGTLIVDNCNYEIHTALKNEITRSSSKMCLITIDYSVEEEYDQSKRINERNYIFLKNEFYQDIIIEILRKLFGTSVTSAELDYISKYSEGYPKMAVLFAEAVRSKKNIPFSDFIEDKLMQKLLFGRDFSDTPKINARYEIAKACSIFSHFGTPQIEELKILNETERKYFADQNEMIYKCVCNPPSDKKSFKETSNYFINKQIFEKRGRYLNVRPTPLAIKLALEWWKYQEVEELKILFPLLENHGLAEPMVERLKYLDQLNEAKQFVNDSWGPKSPFGTAEVLNTELGSKLFRSVVEVNPESLVQSLETAFLNMTKEELLKVDKGRRNLVWALEKLCFRKETFDLAAKLLYAFAVSENESWGNNATNQFIQLFQIFLPGTEVDYDQRLLLIKYGLDKQDNDYTRIAIQALGRGLETHGFHRMGGAEQQGSGSPLKDYHPKTRKEINDYQKNVFNLLVSIVEHNAGFLDLVIEKVARTIRSVINFGSIDIVIPIVKKINSLSDKPLISIIHSLRTTLRYEKLLPQDIDRINGLIDLLSPTDIENKITTLISKPDWEHEKGVDGHFVDKADLRAVEFAKEIIKNGYDLIPFLPQLLKGEQRKGFIFGKSIGELTSDKRSMLDAVLNELKIIKKEEQNPEFLCGYLQNYSEEEQRNIILKVIHTPEIARNAVYLARFYFNRKEDIIALFKLVDDGTIIINELIAISYSHYLNVASVDDLKEICSKIYSYGNEGKWIAIEIITFYIHRDTKRFDLIKDYVKEIISGFNYMINEIRVNSIDDYSYSQLVQDILKQKNEKEFARIISQHIYESFHQKRIPFTDIYIAEISRILVDEYFDDFWPIVSPAILEDGMPYWNIKHILGARQGNYATFDTEGALFRGSNNDTIINWCKIHKPEAPLRIAYMMPISEKENDKLCWHPFAKEIIDNFGDINGILDEIGANMHSFGWSGSAIPYYEDLKRLLELLIHHPIPKVKQWAENNIEGLETTIKREQIDNEERGLGF